MRWRFSFGCWLPLLLGAGAVRPSAYLAGERLAGRVWPQPRQAEPRGTQATTITLDHERHQFQGPAGCEASTAKVGCRVLRNAFKRYQVLFFPHHAEEGLSFLQLDENHSLRPLRKHRHVQLGRRHVASTRLSAATEVEVQDLAAPLGLDTDESYELEVTAEGRVALTAQSAWGALRGLETLSQLVDFNFTTETYFIPDAPFRIKDAPHFPHRGLLVDSARHFLPPARLKGTILAMSFAKLNVLHWHLTEDESFSMPSSSHPELAEKGAWSPSERYTVRDVQEIVDYALLHGVRVIPEFDMPGHVSSWSKSHPELFDEACLRSSRRLAFKPTREVFDFLQGLLAEWTNGTFHDQFLHLGSDEVPFECWRGFQVKDGSTVYEGPRQLFQHFVRSMFDRARGALQRNPIFWDEAFVSADLPQEAVVQVWRDKATLARAAGAGHRVLLSWGWYLDHLNEGWQGMYDNDPLQGIPEEKQRQVLGGEGCMWGETVDGSDQASTIWPRLAAIAERLWSAPTSGAAAAEPRLRAFRCLLLRRGVSAAPVDGKGREAPAGPGACDQRGGNWGLSA